MTLCFKVAIKIFSQIERSFIWNNFKKIEISNLGINKTLKAMLI
jgi:hypothetical protein